MRTLNDELRAALAREEPPDGFAERVLHRVSAPALRRLAGGGRQPVREHRQAPVVRWVAAAAAVIAVAVGLQYRAERQARAAGEAAREQVVQALHIASSKLQLAQTKVIRLHESAATSTESVR